jgi:hypothetical protein
VSWTKIREEAYKAFSEKAFWHLPGRSEVCQKSSIWTATIISRIHTRVSVTEEKSDALPLKITCC